jgi:hypothetical protein
MKIEKMDCPSKPKARVKDTPRFVKLKFVDKTVNTPIAPALYK